MSETEYKVISNGTKLTNCNFCGNCTGSFRQSIQCMKFPDREVARRYAEPICRDNSFKCISVTIYDPSTNKLLYGCNSFLNNFGELHNYQQ